MWLLPCGYKYGVNYINLIKLKSIVFMFAFELHIVYKSSFWNVLPNFICNDFFHKYKVLYAEK